MLPHDAIIKLDDGESARNPIEGRLPARKTMERWLSTESSVKISACSTAAVCVSSFSQFGVRHFIYQMPPRPLSFSSPAQVSGLIPPPPPPPPPPPALAGRTPGSPSIPGA